MGQVTVDHRGRFTHAESECLGIREAQEVFKQSTLYTTHEKCKDLGMDSLVYITKDDYPLLPWLMRGYDQVQPFTAEKEIYNKKLTAACSVLDDALVKLCLRFPVVLQCSKLWSVDKVKLMIKAMLILHNFCLQEPFNEDWWTGNFTAHETGNYTEVFSLAETLLAQQMRENIAKKVFNG